MKKAVKIQITGSVQAMFFRQFIKENADGLNLKGFVRKLENLKLEVFAQGDSENVDKMVEICKTGQKHSAIRNVDVTDQRLQEFQDFKILNI